VHSLVCDKTSKSNAQLVDARMRIGRQGTGLLPCESAAGAALMPPVLSSTSKAAPLLCTLSSDNAPSDTLVGVRCGVCGVPVPGCVELSRSQGSPHTFVLCLVEIPACLCFHGTPLSCRLNSAESMPLGAASTVDRKLACSVDDCAAASRFGPELAPALESKPCFLFAGARLHAPP
jgi:hypothetical protein